MKMEMVISAPADGLVAEVSVKEGDNVDAGDLLVTIEQVDAETK
jgi:pyruvate carboxylase